MLRKLKTYYQQKIIKHSLLVKRLLLLVSIAYTIFLVIVSLVDLDGVPRLGSSFDDKIYHVLAYAFLAVLWMLVSKIRSSKNITLIVCIILLLLFGISLELIQHPINPNRTYDIIDMLANCFGVIFGTLLVKKLNIFKLN